MIERGMHDLTSNAAYGIVSWFRTGLNSLLVSHLHLVCGFRVTHKLVLPLLLFLLTISLFLKIIVKIKALHQHMEVRHLIQLSEHTILKSVEHVLKMKMVKSLDRNVPQQLQLNSLGGSLFFWLQSFVR
jgi:hypothetical protein